MESIDQVHVDGSSEPTIEEIDTEWWHPLASDGCCVLASDGCCVLASDD